MGRRTGMTSGRRDETEEGREYNNAGARVWERIKDEFQSVSRRAHFKEEMRSRRA